MKRQVLFIQGGGKGAHDEWDNKLVESLQKGLGQAFEVRYPRMPHEDDPQYAAWKDALARELGTLRDDAIVVGHSVGGTILVRVLLELAPPRFGALVLIAAPYLGDGGWSIDDVQFPRDLGARLPRGVPVHLFHGLEDETAPPAHVALYARAIPQAQVHRLRGRDHQLNNDLKEVAATIMALD